MSDHTLTPDETEAEVRRVMTAIIGWPRIDRWLESVKREAAANAIEEAERAAKASAVAVLDSDPVHGWTTARRTAWATGAESILSTLRKLAATTRNPRTPGEETT